MTHVRLDQVSKAFRTGGSARAPVKWALNRISFDVAQGEIVALTGPSGCGKTTALRTIMGLETATSGTITVAGKRVAGCGHDRGIVFQHAELLPWKTALGNIQFALAAKGLNSARQREIAERYIALVGLTEARYRRPHQLSGGMKQRVGIARALAIDPEVLLMDEPFGALDPQTREALQIELLAIHERTAKTIVIVTHDVEEAVLLADRVVVMAAGEVLDSIGVDLGRPRGDLRRLRADPEFIAKRALIWDQLQAGPAKASTLPESRRAG